MKGLIRGASVDMYEGGIWRRSHGTAGNNYGVLPVAIDRATSIVTREQYEAALAAAQQPVWDGEGLPPVGCECEFFDCEKWFKVTMMYGGSQLVVLYDHDNQIERSFSTSRIDGKFRPIRSEADRKRDEAIAALKKLKPQLVGELAGYLYDEIAAGKIPHIRIEQAA
ncbi:hypothetical protein ACM91U_003173 [Cronobacter sakazakii]